MAQVGAEGAVSRPRLPRGVLSEEARQALIEGLVEMARHRGPDGSGVARLRGPGRALLCAAQRSRAGRRRLHPSAVAGLRPTSTPSLLRQGEGWPASRHGRPPGIGD